MMTVWAGRLRAGAPLRKRKGEVNAPKQQQKIIQKRQSPPSGAPLGPFPPSKQRFALGRDQQTQSKAKGWFHRSLPAITGQGSLGPGASPARQPWGPWATPHASVAVQQSTRICPRRKSFSQRVRSVRSIPAWWQPKPFSASSFSSRFWLRSRALGAGACVEPVRSARHLWFSFYDLFGVFLFDRYMTLLLSPVSFSQTPCPEKK